MTPPVPNEQPTVVVPCLNEQATVGELLMRLRDVLPGARIICVDDGSTDRTGERIAAAAPWATLLAHSRPQGKGAAIRTALDSLRLDETGLIAIQDADLEYDPADLPMLIERASIPGSDRQSSLAVFGSRFAETGRSAVAGTGRPAVDCGVRTLDRLIGRLGGETIVDHACCYKVLPIPILRSLEVRATGFEWCGEVTMKLLRLARAINRRSAKAEWANAESVTGPVRPGSPVAAPMPRSRPVGDVRAIRQHVVGYRPRTRAAGKKLRLSDGVAVATTILKASAWTPSEAALATAIDLLRPSSIAGADRPVAAGRGLEPTRSSDHPRHRPRPSTSLGRAD